MGHGLAASLRALVQSAGKGGKGKGKGKQGPAAGKRGATSVAALQRHARRVAALREAETRTSAERDAAAVAAREAARRDAPPDVRLRDRYMPGKRTLIVGDGNLSFALAIAQHWASSDSGSRGSRGFNAAAAAATENGDEPQADRDGDGGSGSGDGADAAQAAADLVATVYDSAEAVVAKYPEAAANAAALAALGATVVYGVDGTQLETPAQVALHGCLSAAVIAFHFPHVGLGIKDQARNILENQRLLQAFFASAKQILASPVQARAQKHRRRADDDDDENDGDGDGDGDGGGGGGAAARGAGRPVGPSGRDVGDGGGEVHVTVRRGAPYDAWQVAKLGRTAGLALIDAVPFDVRAFPGYEHRRTLGTVEGISHLHNEEILPKRCVTYIFQRAAPAGPNRKKAKPAGKHA